MQKNLNPLSAEGIAIKAAIVVVSGALWAASFVAHEHLLAITEHAAGIDLVFLPSGLRLLALLIGGVWAAVGVSLGSLFLSSSEFGIQNLWDIAFLSLAAGFIPYLCLSATLRALGIESGLANLSPRHLPMISLGVGAGSSILHNLLFLALGIEAAQDLPGNVTAMAMGDFLGSLIVVILAVAAITLYRRKRA